MEHVWPSLLAIGEYVIIQRERKPWGYYDRLTNTTNPHKVKVVEGDHVHPEDGGDDYFFKFLEDESFTCSKLEKVCGPITFEHPDF